MNQQHENYKICKNCGNRNHPQSGLCPWCGARLRGRMDWFSMVGMSVIILVVIGLVVYATVSRSPLVTKYRLHRINQAAE